MTERRLAAAEATAEPVRGRNRVAYRVHAVRPAVHGLAPFRGHLSSLARRRSPRCRSRDRRTRRHSDSRWLSWFGPDVHRESWLGSSSGRSRRYDTGWLQADRDAGKRSDGLRTGEHEEIRRLRWENRQLREERYHATTLRKRSVNPVWTWERANRTLALSTASTGRCPLRREGARTGSARCSTLLARLPQRRLPAGPNAYHATPHKPIRIQSLIALVSLTQNEPEETRSVLTRRLPAWSSRQAASPAPRSAGVHSGTRFECHVGPRVTARSTGVSRRASAGAVDGIVG